MGDARRGVVGSERVTVRPGQAHTVGIAGDQSSGDHGTRDPDDVAGSQDSLALAALLNEGRVPEAAALAEAIFRQGTLRGDAAALLRLRLASALVMHGEPAAALTQAEAVISESGLGLEAYRAGEQSRLIALMAHGQFAEAREPAVAILAETTSLADGASMAAALTTIGSVAWTEGRVADSVMLFRAAVTQSQRGRFADPAMHPRQSLTVPLVALGKFDEADQLLTDDLEDIAATDDQRWAVGAIVRRSRLHLAAGRPAEAVLAAESALALADALAARLFVPLVRTTLAAIALHRGDLDVAAAHLERCQADPMAAAHFESTVAAWIRARITDALNGASLAMQAMAAVFDDLPACKRAMLEEPGMAPWMVRCALAAGARRKAEAVVDVTEQLSLNNPGLATVAAIAFHARGVLDHDIAALFEAAATHAHPWARASATEDAGAGLVEEGRLRAGVKALATAISMYEEIGAIHDAGRARASWQELRQRVRPREPRPPVSDWPSLTETERRVAALVALGLTNAQVGERMYVSRHTVDFHLRQVFRKLDVRTRVELARLAMEHQDAPDED
jgi:DNA-binding CsgD family transcriptional regulator